MPARNSREPDLEVRLDGEQIRTLLRDARAFDGELAKATRKRLRDAATPAVKDVQRRILSAPSHQARPELRRGLAKGTKLSIRTAKRNPGVSIVTTGAKLPAAKQAMVHAFNKTSFRHRVFGRDVWVQQNGRPYFGAVLDERKQTMRAAMELALKDAADTIRAGEVSS